MRSKTSCGCDSCSFRLGDCNACQKCFPKYMCVTATYIPGPYSTTCPHKITYKLAHDCGAGSWVPYATLPDEAPIVSVSVYEGTPCVWRVAIDGDITEVELADLGQTTFEGDGDAGGYYEIEINPGAGVCYPYAHTECPPCRCGTCMPSAYLFSVVVQKPCVRTLCIYVEWNPNDLQYYGEVPFNDYFSNPGANSIVVVGSPRADVCAVRFSISGLVLNVADFDVNLEGPLPFDGSCEPNGFACKDSSGSVFLDSPSRGGNCRAPYAIPLPWLHLEIADTEYVNDGQPLVIEVSDGTCGGCPETESVCPGACAELNPAFAGDYCAECTPLTGSIVSNCPDAELEVIFYSPPTGEPGVQGCQFDSTGFQIVVEDILTEVNAGLPAQEQYVICQKQWIATKEGLAVWAWGSPPSVSYYVQIALVYLGKPCNGEHTSADPSQYRIAYRAYSTNEPPGCTTPPPNIISGFIAPTVSSCAPFLLEFPWLDWNSGWPCQAGPGQPNPCEDQDGSCVLRITR